jgi:4-amino-4-deoxy-L-arabinose transferase-like glycosyltransferase
MRRESPRFSWPLFIIILIAAGLRLAGLSRVPPGLPFEEVSLAAQALHPPPPLTPGAGSALITFVMSASLALFGPNLLGIRLVAAVCGLMTVVFTYRWIRALYTESAALIACALLAVSFWPLFFSRIGLEAVLLPPLVALGSWCTVRGLARSGSTRGLVWLGAAGLIAGLAVTCPPGGWLMLAVFAVLYGTLIVARRDVLHSAPIGHLAFWGAAILACLPLIAAQRGVTITPQTQSLADALLRGDGGPLIDAITRAGGLWTSQGDSLFHYNPAQWPVFNVALATVFVVGLLHPVFDTSSKSKISNLKSQILPTARLLIPLWLVAGVAAGALIDPERPFTMGIIALPATYVTLALGFDLIGRLITQSGQADWIARRWPGIMTVSLVLIAAEGAWSYFAVGPNDPKAQADYRTDLFSLAGELRGSPPHGGVAISTDAPHNIPPLIFEFLPHGDQPIHWFDAGSALVIPASPGGMAQIDIPEVVAINKRLEQYLGQPSPAAIRVRRYAVPSGDAFLAAFPAPSAQKTWVSDVIAFPPDDPGKVRREIALPVQFGDDVQLLGYQSDNTRQAGKPIRVTLFWRVTRDLIPPLDLSIFAHLLTADGRLAAQQDALGVPSSSWRAGDIIFLIQDVSTDQGLTPGHYHLQIGLYQRSDGQRLPVIVNGAPAGDRLLLEPVEISAP